jgi:DNA-binding GntR family transcriptional regulator
MTKAVFRDAEAISSRLDDIQEQVRNMIADGTLQPGERVNEQALAAQLGVGRNSAREALRSLERSGLVRIVPNRGAEVCKVSLEEALDLYDVRAGIARTAGRLAAARLEEAEEAELMSLMSQMEAALAARDGATYHKLNHVFHERLIAVAKNPRLIALNKAIEAELSLYLRKGVYTMAQMQLSNAEHLRLVDALRSGRVAETAEAFENHILTGKQRMLDTVTRSVRTE